MVLVHRRVNSIPCEACPLEHAMPREIPSLEKALDKVHGPQPLESPLLQMLHLQTVSSIFPSFFFQRLIGSIFRNEAESKDDDHLPTTPARVPKVVAPDDEVADGGYYTSPPMTVVASTASVPNFIVGRKGYGTISFKSPVDLTDVASLSILREIVEITRGTVTVYPDESKKPPLGKGLNVPALVTLENVQPPPDFEGDEFIEELRVRPDTEFVSYNVETGEYVFNVEHFSTYSAIPETSAYSSKSTIHSRRSERFWSNQATTVDPSQSLDPGMRRSYLTRADPAERTLKKILLLGTQ